MQRIDEDHFVFPVVITVKKDKSVKIALNSRKINASCIKMRPQIANMGELLNQTSTEITRVQNEQLLEIDLEHVHDQQKLAEETY